MMSSLGRHLLLNFVLDLSSQEYTSNTKVGSNLSNEIALAARWRVERDCPYMEPGWRVDTQGEKRQSALITEQVLFDFLRSHALWTKHRLATGLHGLGHIRWWRLWRM